jgi:hypothetical protein
MVDKHNLSIVYQRMLALTALVRLLRLISDGMTSDEYPEVFVLFATINQLDSSVFPPLLSTVCRRLYDACFPQNNGELSAFDKQYALMTAVAASNVTGPSLGPKQPPVGDWYEELEDAIQSSEQAPASFAEVSVGGPEECFIGMEDPGCACDDVFEGDVAVQFCIVAL